MHAEKEQQSEHQYDQATSRRTLCVATSPRSSVHVKSRSPLSAGDDVEDEVGIGRHRGMEFSAKHLLAGIRAVKSVHDMTWDRPSDVVQTESRLHRMHDHRANLDGLAALRVLRQAHPYLSELAHGSQPPTVTSTSAAVDQSVPSLMTRDSEDLLGHGETHPGSDARSPVARSELDLQNARQRIALRKQMNALDVVLLGHRTVDGDRDGYDVAVLGEPRDLELDPAGQ